MNFSTLKLSQDILSNLETIGYESMTPIQEKTLPIIIEGKDLIGQAKTGSGKTAAFGLGVLNKLNVKLKRPQALILCPTRELAEQVANELRRLARFTDNIKILTICGGTHETHQVKSLSHGAHIIVGTPGRVFKFLKEKVLDPSNIETLVLDEADRMLDMGFYDSIQNIVRYIPEDRQTLLFSATFPYSIKELSGYMQVDPTLIKVDTEHEEETIKQYFYEVDSHKDKAKLVPKLLAEYQPESTVIFCKTKTICDDVAKQLRDLGIFALALHGDHDQRDRTLVLTKFSNNSCSVLVATDVAARGLDINDLQLVINFDLSNDPEVYVHRIGRTGRIGKAGLALSIFIEQERYKLDDIKGYLKQDNIIRNEADLDLTKSYELEPPMDTIFISGGKKDKLRPGDIVGAIIGTSGIEAKYIGDINILNVLSYVAVDAKYSEKVVQSLQEGKIKKRNFRVGLA